MSDTSRGEGWWKASDGKWYPPEQHPQHAAAGHQAGAQPPPAGGAQPPGGGAPAAAGSAGGAGAGRIALGVVLALVLVVGAVVVVLQVSDDSAAADTVVLEEADDPGFDPFYEGLVPDENAAAMASFAEEGLPGSEDATDGPDGTGGSDADVGPGTGDGYGAEDGAAPGLYGGTQDETSCDVDQLAEFLGENEDKARTWAEVLNLEVDEIDMYLDTLTPVNLATDTRVLNHGFENGIATPRESVLQRGTAVLVDVRGVPRVKCGCGNPLLEPTVEAEETYEGERWPSFEVNQVIVVEVSNVEINNFQIVNVTTGDTFERPAGSRGEADVPPEPEEPEPQEPEEPTEPTQGEAEEPPDDPGADDPGPEIEGPPDGQGGPDPGDGLGGPQLDACREVVEDAYGVEYGLEVSGDVSCGEAADIAQGFLDGGPGGVGPSRHSSEIQGWSCAGTGEPGYNDGVYATCSSQAGMVQLLL